MKKTLLMSAALMSGMCAFAQADGTDVTPANYHFYQATDIPWFNNKVAVAAGEGAGIQLTGANYGTAGGGVWQSFNGAADEYYNGGLIGIVSGGGLQQGDDKKDVSGNLLDGCSLVDLGGEVGQVFCWNGKNSGLIDKLTELYPEEADRWAEIPVQPDWVGGWNFNFFLNPEDICTRATGYYRMRMVFNVLANDFDGTGVFTNIYQVNNQGNNSSYIGEEAYNDYNGAYVVPQVKNSLCIERTSSGSPKEDADGNYIWDPTQWAVLDYYFNVAGDVEGKDEDGNLTVPVRIKMQVQAGAAWANYAVLIRDISFTKYDELLTEEIYSQNVNDPTMQTMSVGTFGDMPGTDEPGDEPGPEVETLYLVGGNVDGEDSWSNGKEMTYADGVYTWTGTVLGSGFKINNGGWDNPEYNIGAADKSVLLVLGEPYAVIASGDSQDIMFDGGEVESPTVVFDPEAMTVTVTGNAGVESILDDNAPAEYYNLQGVKVANPENGLYIRKQGKNVTKVLVK